MHEGLQPGFSWVAVEIRGAKPRLNVAVSKYLTSREFVEWRLKSAHLAQDTQSDVRAQ